VTTILFSGGSAWVLVKLVTLAFGLIAVSRLLPGPNRQVPGYKARPVRAAVRYGSGLLAGAVLVVGCAAVLHGRPGSSPTARGPASGQALADDDQTAAATVRLRTGVFVAGATASYRPVDAFAKLTRTRPGLVIYYSGWNDPFQVRFAGWAHAHGAVPFVQMEPGGVSLASIAAGRSDSYLRSFAAAVRAYRYPVAVSFGPEANGPFYSWGCAHTPARVYVAAWRHVHSVMATIGARNIIWTWDMNRIYHATCPLAARWPGARYVDWIGVDGYWRGRGDTFASVLAPTIRAALRLARKPVIIGETGAADVPQAAGWVRSLFQGAKRTARVIGIVWFNYRDRLGDYQLQDDPAALAQFRRETRNHH
jgi:mannan endo-1,4-beta-mannosidase